MLRATYVDATDSYVVTVGAAVLPGADKAASRGAGDRRRRRGALRRARRAGRGHAGRRVHRQAAPAVRGRLGGHLRRPLHRWLRRHPAKGAGHRGQLHGRGDDERGNGGSARRAVGARRAGAAAQLPRDAGMLRALRNLTMPPAPRMLGRVLAGAGAAVALGLLPALPAAGAVAAPADTVRDTQQWVFNMMNVQAAWQVTEGSGVTVAVIDSGVYPQRVRPVGRLGNPRPRLHRAAYLAAEPELGPARHVDGVHHRRARPRRRFRRGQGDRAGGQDPLDPGDTRQGRPRLPGLQQRARGAHPGRARRRDHDGRQGPRPGDQHVDRLLGAKRRGAQRHHVRLSARHRPGRVVRQLGRQRHAARQGQPRHGPGIVPRRVPGRARRGRGHHRRHAGQLLKRQPLRPGRRAGQGRPRPGQERPLLHRRRDEPGVRARGGRRRADRSPGTRRSPRHW